MAPGGVRVRRMVGAGVVRKGRRGLEVKRKKKRQEKDRCPIKCVVCVIAA